MIKYFETIRCENGIVYYLDYHKKRIFSTIGKNLDFILNPPDNKLYRIKVIYTKDEVCDISYYTYTPKKIKNFTLIFDDNIKYNYKYLNRDQIDKYIKDKSDEIIFIKNGYITDTSIANIAIKIDDIWLTPKEPLLYGTTRQRYLDNKFLKEADITVEMLKKSEKIMTLNAMVVKEYLKQDYF